VARLPDDDLDELAATSPLPVGFRARRARAARYASSIFVLLPPASEDQRSCCGCRALPHLICTEFARLVKPQCKLGQVSRPLNQLVKGAIGGFRVAVLGRHPCVARSDQYRRFAHECLVLARGAEDERARASLLHMAQVWCRLAEECVNETDEKQSAKS
jgi:hypothetical protein